MFKDESDCARYGRTVQGPNRAKISDLLALQKASRAHATGPNIRAWVYVLLSCALFLRKSEAANLKFGDIEVPVDPVTGELVMTDYLPRYLFVNIRRSKTDQAAKGT